MDSLRNSLGQPIGFPVADWKPPIRPQREIIQGRTCRLEPLSVEQHSEALFAADAADESGKSWTYLGYGPFPNLVEYQHWMSTVCAGDDPLFFAVVDRSTGRPVGVSSYLNIVPAMGSIEVGHIHYSPSLQRSPAATEAMYLCMKYAFELGYRRYEWKCDALNQPSRDAAQRLGFSYEGIFRQATVYKGRNRNTAWYAAIDREWPALQEAFSTWLAPGNFDGDGRQRSRLSDLTAPILKQRG
ncbi:MAG: GNAT family protein [Acidobacteriota bacterium]